MTDLLPMDPDGICLQGHGAHILYPTNNNNHDILLL